MTHSEKSTSASCSGHCHECPATNGARPAGGDTGLDGWRLVLASAAVFLLPLALGIAGAVLSRGRPALQPLWAAGGLMLGVLLARAMTWAMRAGATAR